MKPLTKRSKPAAIMIRGQNRFMARMMPNDEDDRRLMQRTRAMSMAPSNPATTKPQRHRLFGQSTGSAKSSHETRVDQAHDTRDSEPQRGHENDKCDSLAQYRLHRAQQECNGTYQRNKDGDYDSGQLDVAIPSRRVKCHSDEESNNRGTYHRQNAAHGLAHDTVAERSSSRTAAGA
jgi:hypothetical protein